MSGVPQGTVLGPSLFLIMIIDIDQGISTSTKLVSFADDTRVYSCINDIELGINQSIYCTRPFHTSGLKRHLASY